METILTSIKLLLGITEEQTEFDMQLIMHINSVFLILNQIGIGPDTPFTIVAGSESWDDFSDDIDEISAVKTYVYLKVKLMFDTTTVGSATIESINRQISELEWRLNVQVDPGDN